MVSARAKAITRRTYNRPKEDGNFESWDETIDRCMDHQTWLWERAKGKPLSPKELVEINELRNLLLDRKASLSGRTLWLGGTEVSKRRESSQFNCSFLKVETVYDMVDALWLLLNGCGVGFEPISGTLNGFTNRIKKVEFIQSKRTESGGRDVNLETWEWVNDEYVWTISIGDSAEAWAKSIGKILAGKKKVDKLVIDCSQIRPAGTRLKGYGWISSGDSSLIKAYKAIIGILNKRSGSLLSRIDIMDIVNWLGTILSSRRSAEICLIPYGDKEWKDFAVAKREFWVKNPQRSQSNNSLLFWDKPTREELSEIFDLIIESGGSEPGFINAKSALKRAPWFSGVNPCAK